jgi:lipopolysaccharide assembly protein B
VTWLEISIILLPFASLSGYAIGKRGGEKSSGQRVDLLSRQYFQGLNHLLNEEQDQAIALFERIADDDTDRFETQLALGSLFRRRGELERAIRLHQDLSVKAMLTTEQRGIALLELGDDFVRAGLLDRAEALFDELLAIDAQSAPALKQLIGIYEQERDWQKAASAAVEYQRLTHEPMGKLIAHFHCELALAARSGAQLDAELAAAASADSDSIRVMLMAAERGIELCDVPRTVAALNQVLDTDAQFIPQLLPLLERLRPMDASAADSLLAQCVQQEKGSAAILAQCTFLTPLAALSALRARLDSKPSPRVLARWMNTLGYVTEATDAVATLHDLSRVSSVLQSSSPLTHRCSQCGFGTMQQHWQCPSCKAWGSTKPLALL